jgi:hypothetical protein
MKRYNPAETTLSLSVPTGRVNPAAAMKRQIESPGRESNARLRRPNDCVPRFSSRVRMGEEWMDKHRWCTLLG